LAEAEAIAAVGLAGGPAEEPLLAESLLAAIDALGMVTGHTIGTDLLDRIFSRHCVGK
jgi:tRNA U34 5-carboxymethylaminomethyl modifying GTPase MnmE/TrmE